MSQLLRYAIQEEDAVRQQTAHKSAKAAKRARQRAAKAQQAAGSSGFAGVAALAEQSAATASEPAPAPASEAFAGVGRNMAAAAAEQLQSVDLNGSGPAAAEDAAAGDASWHSCPITKASCCCCLNKISLISVAALPPSLLNHRKHNADADCHVNVAM
jgi:hypothetical protein